MEELVDRMKLVEYPTVEVVMKKTDGYAYVCKNGLAVIQSLEVLDGKVWLHTSFSRRSRMPDYHDMVFVKRVFIGDDRRAIMILPEKKNHVNIHEFCLHFFTGDDGLPDFTHGKGTL